VTSPATRDPRAEGLRSVLAPLAVTLLGAALLAALDGLPALVAGEPRGLRRAANLEEAERALHARLVLPAYFPASLRWPPHRIRYLVGQPSAVALAVDAQDGSPHLLLAETTGPGAVPTELLPDAPVLSRSPVAVGPAQGMLSRVVDDGVVTLEVEWQLGGRSLLLRSRGSLDELLRMARSAREAP